MTKKELFEALENYSDDTEVLIYQEALDAALEIYEIRPGQGPNEKNAVVLDPG